MRVALIGSNTDNRITSYSEAVIDALIERYGEQVQFIMSDTKGTDASFNKIMSSKGLLGKSLVLGIEHCRHNDYDVPEYLFTKEYDEEAEILKVYDPNGMAKTIEVKGGSIEICEKSREYYTYIREALLDMCDVALVVWDGDSKPEFNAINKLTVKDKFIYLDRI